MEVDFTHDLEAKLTAYRIREDAIDIVRILRSAQDWRNGVARPNGNTKSISPRRHGGSRRTATEEGDESAQKLAFRARSRDLLCEPLCLCGESLLFSDREAGRINYSALATGSSLFTASSLSVAMSLSMDSSKTR